MIDSGWPFDQSPDCAAMTLRAIAFEGAPVLHVTHDADDYGWQFLGAGPPDKNQAAVLALSEIVRLDPSVLEIADLPPGWHAWRESKSKPWRRQAVSTSNPLDRRCPSCAAPASGRYCSACGERFLVEHDFSLQHFFLETLPHEVLDIDGKFLRTLRLQLLRPGFLALEYVAGRRQQYVGPLRFYVIAFLLHAALAAVLAGHGPTLSEHIREGDPTQLLARLAASRSEVNWNDSELRTTLSDRGHWLGEIGTMLIFLAIAALQKLVFFRTGRRYLEHVALALNIVSSYIVVLLLAEVGIGIFGRSHFADYDVNAQTWVGLTLLPVYWFLAIRRFYGVRALPSLSGALIMWVGHVTIAFCLNLMVLALLIETA